MNAIVRNERERAPGRDAVTELRETAPEADSPPTRSLRARLRLPLMIGVPLIVGAAGLYYYLISARYQSTDDAYVRAAQVTVSSNVSGRVSEVDVHDNQQVHQGETLFRIDDRPFRIAVEEAAARLANTQLEIEALKATYLQRIADLRAAQSALDYQQHEYERQSRLVTSGIASQAQVERALMARNESEQRVAAAKQQITSTLASLGGDPAIPVDRHPTVQQAQAQLDRAKLNLSYTTISAPIDGVVTRVEQLQVGNYINAATPAFALVSSKDMWIEANFKENQLAHVRIGQPARVSIDAYPGRSFRARVVSVSPGTGAEFSLLPAENATGNWVKVVQRLPVRLELEGADLPTLRSGLSANVSVDTQYRQGLLGLGTGPVEGSATNTAAR
jgi:membrane fusion protein (multidrug efflux system)